MTKVRISHHVVSDYEGTQAYQCNNDGEGVPLDAPSQRLREEYSRARATQRRKDGSLVLDLDPEMAAELAEYVSTWQDGYSDNMGWDAEARGGFLSGKALLRKLADVKREVETKAFEGFTTHERQFPVGSLA